MLVNLLLVFNLVFANDPNLTCMMDQSGGLPKIKFRGDTREQAMERVVRLCLNLRTQQYFALRNSAPSTERMIIFMEDCVNKTFCYHKTGK